MAFTEFCCRSGGSNLNGGCLASNAEPATSAVYTCTNSNWDGTSVFTPADGSTPASTVTVGDFASVFLDAATVAVYIARVTAVAAGVNGAITLDTTAKAGSAPASGATGRTIKVGGAWKGPNAAEAFPLNFLTAASKNAAGDFYRINFKNDATYSITAAITQSLAGPGQLQGYTTTFGDGGKATIDGGTSGTSYVLITCQAMTDAVWADLIFQNNGATGSANGFVCNGGTRVILRRVVVNSVRGIGIQLNSSGPACMAIECETYACNQSNTASTGGMHMQTGSVALRCISHDNTGNAACGFVGNSSSSTWSDCISDSNGLHGFLFTAAASHNLKNCDFYNNGGSGITGTTTAFLYIENCNFVKNTAWGILLTTATTRLGFIMNCAFGSGSQANGSGTTSLLGSITETGSITYASGVTPWTDPANGDFRINLAAAKNAGIGAFTQTAASYAGTIGYPDIGAAFAAAVVATVTSLATGLAQAYHQFRGGRIFG